MRGQVKGSASATRHDPPRRNVWPMSALELARSLHEALVAGHHGEDLRPLFTDDAVTIEHPNLLNPDGATMQLEEMLAGATAGARLLARQRYDVHQAIDRDEEAVLRLSWTGVVARDAGPFAEGQELCAHIVQFIRTRDGRIHEIETYDCYEPFHATVTQP